MMRKLLTIFGHRRNKMSKLIELKESIKKLALTCYNSIEELEKATKKMGYYSFKGIDMPIDKKLEFYHSKINEHLKVFNDDPEFHICACWKLINDII